MGSETQGALKAQNEITVIMMIGLQGAGKTTTTAKLAGKFKAKGSKPLPCGLRRLPSCCDQTVTGKR